MRPARGTISTFRGPGEIRHGRIPARPAPAGASGCYISDHNRTSAMWGQLGLEEQGKTRRSSLEWLTDAGEFASIYANALPGFLLARLRRPVKVDGTISRRRWSDWRQTCKSDDPQLVSKFLSRAVRPNLENELWKRGPRRSVNAKLDPPKPPPKQLQERPRTKWYKPREMTPGPLFSRSLRGEGLEGLS